MPLSRHMASPETRVGWIRWLFVVQLHASHTLIPQSLYEQENHQSASLALRQEIVALAVMVLGYGLYS